jgi:hypothetical protein
MQATFGLVFRTLLPTPKVVSRVCIAVVLFAVAVLYVSRLPRSPAYLSIEEVGAARDALIFAKTGRNEGGQRWPLYFGGSAFVAGGGGAPSRDPVFTYFQAALLAVVPFSEAVVRLPSAVAGSRFAVFSSVRSARRRSSSAGRSSGRWCW